MNIDKQHLQYLLLSDDTLNRIITDHIIPLLDSRGYTVIPPNTIPSGNLALGKRLGVSELNDQSCGALAETPLTKTGKNPEWNPELINRAEGLTGPILVIDGQGNYRRYDRGELANNHRNLFAMIGQALGGLAHRLIRLRTDRLAREGNEGPDVPQPLPTAKGDDRACGNNPAV